MASNIFGKTVYLSRGDHEPIVTWYGTDVAMELEQAQARIQELETERTALKAEIIALAAELPKNKLPAKAKEIIGNAGIYKALGY